jgi:hypothetical protein
LWPALGDIEGFVRACFKTAALTAGQQMMFDVDRCTAARCCSGLHHSLAFQLLRNRLSEHKAA